ncbi:MAG TPA: ATP-binding protein [Nocardioidaceae bacterium]|nr:ATP-binding protein [Nocardioidaceae bacterium]
MAYGAGRRRRGRGNRRLSAFVLSGLVIFVGLVYGTVVLGVGALIGDRGAPSLGLTVVATAIVALAFEPVRVRLERRVNEMLHGSPTSPYEVLSHFSETIVGRYDGAEIPGRMAKLLADGTDANWSQVWLVVSGRLTLAATWPGSIDPALEPPEPGDDARDASGPRRRALPVRHDGELLAVLRLEERGHRPMSSVEKRLFIGLAAQAGLVLRGVRLRAELSQRLAELTDRAEELRQSRLRLVTALGNERTKLERDIHDGAQQHLVALAVNLRLALTLVPGSPLRAGELLEQQEVAAETALETLEELSRGLYPRRLIDEGLAAALRAATASGSLPVTILDRSTRRLSADVETALYFCCLEALQNAAKHADATRASVGIEAAIDGEVRLVVEDDGRGFDADRIRMGAGLANMRDRIDAVGGRLDLHSRPGNGARLDIHVPLRRPVSVVD